MGPMTGRAAGYCAGYPVPGFMNPVSGGGRGMAWGRGGGYGRGLGLGFRGGRGFGRRGGWGAAPYAPAPYAYAPPAPAYGVPYPPAPAPEQEIEALKGQAQYLEDALEGVRKRISELETETEGKQG